MWLDIKNLFLGTALDRYEYMKILLNLFPQQIIDQYDLSEKAKDEYI